MNLSSQEALIYVMVTISAVDRTISDSELTRIGSLVKNLPVFDGFDTDRLVQVSSDCGEALGKINGLKDVLIAIHNALPDKHYDTAYALAVEIAAADRVIEPEELRFLAMLRDTLGLDKLTIAAIEAGARARYKKL